MVWVCMDGIDSVKLTKSMYYSHKLLLESMHNELTTMEVSGGVPIYWWQNIGAYLPVARQALSCTHTLTCIHRCRSISGNCDPHADDESEVSLVAPTVINPHSFNTVSSTMTLLPALLPSGVSLVGGRSSSFASSSSSRRFSGTRKSMDPEGKLLSRMAWIPPQAASGLVVKINLDDDTCTCFKE